MNGPVYSPWDELPEFDPLDVLDEREWLSLEEQDDRFERENGTDWHE